MSAVTGRVEVVPASEARWPRAVATAAGVMMVGGAGLNLVLVTVAPDGYAPLGEWMNGPDALEQLWAATLGAHPRIWVPVVGIGYELTVGVLALSRDRRRRAIGLAGVVAFKLGLLAMGLWVWAVPWLAVLLPTLWVTARHRA